MCQFYFHFRKLFGAYCDLIILVHVLILWNLARSFATSVSANLKYGTTGSDISRKWKEIESEYLELKTLAKLINEAFGTNVTFILFEFVLNYSVILDELFLFYDNPNWISIMDVTFYFCSSSIIFFLAADVCYQVSGQKRNVSLYSIYSRGTNKICTFFYSGGCHLRVGH